MAEPQEQERDEESFSESESQEAEDVPPEAVPAPFQTRDRFLVPLDTRGCFFCDEKQCARVFVRVFIPGTNSRGTRNHYDHPQNGAILPICKAFFTQLQDACHSNLSAETEEGRTRPYIILACAGLVFQKYYLPDAPCTRYFHHIKRVRLSHRFDFGPEEGAQSQRR